MTMTVQEIATALTSIETLLVQKLQGPPKLEMSLSIKVSGRVNVCIYGAKDYDMLHYVTEASAEKCLERTEAFIRAMPDPEHQRLQSWHKKLGEVIDEGHAMVLPDAVMEPLRAGSQAVNDLMLPPPPETITLEDF